VNFVRMDYGNVVSVLLVILCVIVVYDLIMQYQITANIRTQHEYNEAVKSSVDYWTLGYRIEDLDAKLAYQVYIFFFFLTHLLTFSL